MAKHAKRGAAAIEVDKTMLDDDVMRRPDMGGCCIVRDGVNIGGGVLNVQRQRLYQGLPGNICCPEACVDGDNPSCMGIDLWPDDRAVALDAKHNASLLLTHHSSKKQDRLRHDVPSWFTSIATD